MDLSGPFCGAFGGPFCGIFGDPFGGPFVGPFGGLFWVTFGSPFYEQWVKCSVFEYQIQYNTYFLISWCLINIIMASLYIIITALSWPILEFPIVNQTYAPSKQYSLHTYNSHQMDH